MVKVNDEIEYQLRYLQEEIRKEKRADARQKIELAELKNSIVRINLQARESNERLNLAHALVDSAVESQRRKLECWRAGKQSFLETLETLDEPEHRVTVSKAGEVYRL